MHLFNDRCNHAVSEKNTRHPLDDEIEFWAQMTVIKAGQSPNEEAHFGDFQRRRRRVVRFG